MLHCSHSLPEVTQSIERMIPTGGGYWDTTQMKEKSTLLSFTLEQASMAFFPKKGTQWTTGSYFKACLNLSCLANRVMMPWWPIFHHSCPQEFSGILPVLFLFSVRAILHRYTEPMPSYLWVMHPFTSKEFWSSQPWLICCKSIILPCSLSWLEHNTILFSQR